MIYRQPRIDERRSFDRLAQHPLQSWAWGDFRELTSIDVERLAGFEDADMVGTMQVTFHPIPKLPYTVGYFPKGVWPDEIQLNALKELGKRKKAIFIKLEPNVSKPPKNDNDISGLRDFFLHNGCESGRALFTPYTFVVDLTKSEEDLLYAMKSKTRYNLRVAEKHGVQIVEDSSEQGFAEYLELLRITTKRQQFYAHTETYQKQMWQMMHGAGIAHLLKAVYQGKTVAAWVLFVHNHVLYYPYGASSREHRDTMASNLLMWEAMRFGKRMSCHAFDLWGSLGSDPDTKDPWYGFHRFKEGYGGVLTEFVGTYDLIVDYPLYKFYRIADRWRWRFLRLRSRLPI